jgi:hypothetical protein
MLNSPDRQFRASTRIEAASTPKAQPMAYKKPELTRIGGIDAIRFKPGNGGDHNDGTYFRYPKGY